MPDATTMLHVRVDGDLKARAAKTLQGVGLTLSDAVRILLAQVVAEGGLPVGLATNARAYDLWFRAKVQEALDDPRPAIPHEDVMREMRTLIESKIVAQS